MVALDAANLLPEICPTDRTTHAWNHTCASLLVEALLLAAKCYSQSECPAEI